MPMNTITPPGGDKINETYWPPLRKMLKEDPSAMDRLDLECMLCKMPMPAKPDDAVMGDTSRDHSARILLCGHLVGFSCICRHFAHCKQRNIRATCPLNTCVSLNYSECGCFHVGELIPKGLEDLKGPQVETRTRGGLLPPRCILCACHLMLHGLTMLAMVHEPHLARQLRSQEVGFIVNLDQNEGVRWGFAREDTRQGTEIEIPASMRGHCEIVDAELASMFPLFEHPAKICFWRYSRPYPGDLRDACPPLCSS